MKTKTVYAENASNRIKTTDTIFKFVPYYLYCNLINTIKKKAVLLKYFSDLQKLLKSKLPEFKSEFLNMFGYYRRGLFTEDEAKRITEAKKTAEALIEYNKKHGTVGRGFNDFE